MSTVRKRVAVAASILVVIGAVVAIGIPVRAAVLTDQACGLVRDYVAENGPVQTVGSGPLRVSVLGDSYTAGDILDERDDRWVTRFAELEDATVSFDGIGSTGFVNSGACEHNTFAERGEYLAAEDADTLIIQGGLNDVGMEGVEAAAGAVIQEASASHVIIVGPVDTPSRSGEEAVDEALRAAAEAHGAEYVSALDWSVELVDGLHMTPEGHVEYAERVAAALDDR